METRPKPQSDLVSLLVPIQCKYADTVRVRLGCKIQSTYYVLWHSAAPAPAVLGLGPTLSSHLARPRCTALRLVLVPPVSLSFIDCSLPGPGTCASAGAALPCFLGFLERPCPLLSNRLLFPSYPLFSPLHTLTTRPPLVSDLLPPTSSAAPLEYAGFSPSCLSSFLVLGFCGCPRTSRFFHVRLAGGWFNGTDWPSRLIGLAVAE